MIEKNEAMELIKNTFSSLTRSGTLETEVNVTDGTVLLGAGSSLDSIAFVTFITEFEDQLQEKTNEEHFLVLSDINDFNVSNPSLTAETLAEYTTKITAND